MKKYLLLLGAVLCSLHSQTSYNVSLYGHLDLYGQGNSAISYSEIWGWTDTVKNREYAIIGTPGGTSIVDITDSVLKEVSFQIGPPFSANYHEFRTYKNYLYVGAEGTDPTKRPGIQIIDLSPLPDSTTFKRTFVWDNIYFRAHTVSIEKNFLYVNGGDFGGTRIMDISDPLSPVQVGSYGKGSTPYVHDSFIKNDTLYAAAIYAGRTDIVDLTVKGNYTEATAAKIISKTPTVPEGSTHQVWLSEDGNYMFVSTETPGGHLHIYDIRNRTAPVEIAAWSSSPTESIHNSFVKGDFLYIAYYKEGLRVLDIKDPHTPIEVGFYDTYPQNQIDPDIPYRGAWGAYPYFPSGKIAVSDMNTGLYVFTFNKKYGGRVTGNVRDAITNAPINNVQVTVEETGRTFSTDATGRYTYGTAEGLHTIRFYKEGYAEKIDAFTTRAGMLDTLNIFLQHGVVNVNNSDENVSPKGFYLSQNYPNPFNPLTSISFSVEEKSFVNLSVYNLLGEKVATIVDQNLEKGKHTANFNAQQLSSGIYFYRLTAGSYTAVKRMTVLK